MPLPYALPPPPDIRQGRARCWAASYESWDLAQSGRMGMSPNLAQSEIIAMFDRATTREDNPDTPNVNERRGVLTTNRGGATHAGRVAVVVVGFMSLRHYHPGAVTPTRVAELLENAGYIYCAYYWGNGDPGHAVVIYGAGASSFDVMDPLQGLITVPAATISGSGNVDVYLGTSLIPVLRAGLDEAFSNLTPPSTPQM